MADYNGNGMVSGGNSVSAASILASAYRPEPDPSSPASPINYEALCKSVERSYKALRPFREITTMLIKEAAGPLYGNTGDKSEKYINKVNQFVQTYSMLVAADDPQYFVVPQQTILEAFASLYETTLNNHVRRIGLKYTAQRTIMDAMFGIGVVRTYMASSPYVENEVELDADPGRPYVSNILQDDFVYDMAASCWSAVRYAGNMYRLPFAAFQKAVDSGVYDAEAAKDVQPNTKWSSNDPQRADAIARGQEMDGDEFQPMIDLADVWEASTRTICTFVVTDRDQFCCKPVPLACIPHDEPDGIPFQILAFEDVPGSVMPIGPAVHMFPLERAANQILRKNIRSALRFKSFIMVDQAGAQTGTAIKTVSDGGIVTGNPQMATPMKTGGVDPASQAFCDALLSYENLEGGNIEAAAGQGAQTSTVGQEELIHAANDRRIQQFSYRVADWLGRVGRSLGYLLWKNDLHEVVSRFEPPGLKGYSIDRHWKEGDREGKFLDYNFVPNVYSYQYRSPEAAAQQITQLLTQFYAPLWAIFAQQGMTMNGPAITQFFAKTMHRPELNDFIQSGSAPPPDEAPQMGDVPSPAMRTRNYVQRSEANPQSSRSAIQQLWMGQAANGQSGAQVGIPGAA